MLGGLALALVGVVLLALVVVGLRELAGFSRLRRLDRLRRAAEAALAEQDLAQARAVTARLMQVYATRDDTK